MVGVSPDPLARLLAAYRTHAHARAGQSAVARDHVAFAAAIVRGQHWRAGLWLAAAACLKVLPLFLLILPLWRATFAAWQSALVGLIVGLFAIPSAFLAQSEPPTTTSSTRPSCFFRVWGKDRISLARRS